jgi:predicted ester cyclase
MSISENKELVRRYLEAISGQPKTEELLDLFMTDATLKAHILATEAGVPLYRFDAEEIIAEGDLVAVRARFSGVHQGEFVGIPATGRSLDVVGFITYRVAGGKIVDHWLVIDTMTMMQQLGAVPQPTSH